MCLITGDVAMKKIPILYENKEECCGCTACYSVCSQRAISMVVDEEGFEYPQIDNSKCMGCYQCIKVCPFKTVSADLQIYIGGHKKPDSVKFRQSC